MISFEAARAKVIEVLSARACAPERETLDLSIAPAAPLGRILAESIIADRNYPPFKRSIRDGFAVRSADATAPGAKLQLIAESRAGVAYTGTVGTGVGQCPNQVAPRPRVAILSTGDEIVPVDCPPGPFQIRNSNNISLAAQVTLAGGEALAAGSARDEVAELRERIEQGLEADLLLLSGGVSAGKYDLVEQVLKDLGAEIFFDAVALRPGKPVVFGWCRGKPVFGLPGNPVSTMVTFELFVVPAIEALSGCPPKPLPLFKARLAHPVDEKGGVAHVLPARVTWPKGEEGPEPKVEGLLWEGSGDIGAVVR